MTSEEDWKQEIAGTSSITAQPHPPQEIMVLE